MPYIIDGHNLIPKLPGLSLAAPDDEPRLIELLQAYCRRRRKQVEVYFDNAPPGQAGERRFGAVTARFVRQGRTADDAIRGRLSRLGRSARNWIVITSDKSVQASAREAHAGVVSAEAFAEELAQTLGQTAPPRDEEKPESTPSAEEVEDWLALFLGRPKKR